MGKDKSEKKDKKEKKEKRRSETDGVHKSSKKEKKEKKLSEVAEKELTAQVLEGLEKKDAVEEVVAVNGEAAETPIGALVPFANPLAEDKTAKKVFKTVKKGAFSFFQSFLLVSNSQQPPSTNLSNEVSKKSSKPSAKVPPQLQMHPSQNPLASSFSQQTSLPWTSLAISRSCARIMVFPTSLSHRAPSSVLPAPPRGLQVLLW